MQFSQDKYEVLKRVNTERECEIAQLRQVITGLEILLLNKERGKFDIDKIDIIYINISDNKNQYPEFAIEKFKKRERDEKNKRCSTKFKRIQIMIIHNYSIK